MVGKPCPIALLRPSRDESNGSKDHAPSAAARPPVAAKEIICVPEHPTAQCATVYTFPPWKVFAVLRMSNLQREQTGRSVANSDDMARLCHGCLCRRLQFALSGGTLSPLRSNQPRSGDICVSRGRGPAVKWKNDRAAKRRHSYDLDTKGISPYPTTELPGRWTKLKEAVPYKTSVSKLLHRNVKLS